MPRSSTVRMMLTMMAACSRTASAAAASASAWMTSSCITSISCVPFQVSFIMARNRAPHPTCHRCLNKNHYLVVADQGTITFISITQTPHHDTSPLSVVAKQLQLNRQ
uniref:(northern house mosquito) hypothetical protein n=1 Tax=Culex pipiens TaxID=7175 RepID=A0A8D8AEP2_CULPI